jgi:quinol monooxygenase YgiN
VRSAACGATLDVRRDHSASQAGPDRIAGTPGKADERYADESAFEAHLASPHFSTWLKGEVLPSLEDRVRLDLVPLEG